ncbi:MAG: hypothetical protein BJ554DRAFT_7807, partial [Olpidium bornovanus]
TVHWVKLLPGYAIKRSLCEFQVLFLTIVRRGRKWYSDAHRPLTQAGYSQSIFDPCLCFDKANDVLLLLGVDDMLISGPSKTTTSAAKK